MFIIFYLFKNWQWLFPVPGIIFHCSNIKQIVKQTFQIEFISIYNIMAETCDTSYNF